MDQELAQAGLTLAAGLVSAVAIYFGIVIGSRSGRRKIQEIEQERLGIEKERLELQRKTLEAQREGRRLEAARRGETWR